ncbi:aldo/keto reductase [Litchfieldella rifensis]|uniref:Aldo/keto reductase n=1 Tax=Litchfieldella rifensis TaxID=762643 RepID=A0ABV7LPU5_9GAMM
MLALAFQEPWRRSASPIKGLSSPANHRDGYDGTIRRQCEASLKRLRTDHLDLYYLHRLDRQVPIELMRENLAAETISLDAATVTRLNAMMTPDQVAGARYSEAQQADIDTEEFASLKKSTS